MATKKNKGVMVLGLDTGFSNIGWTVGRMRPGSSMCFDIVDMGHIETKKTSRKKNVRQADDIVERGRKIAQHLEGIFEKHQPKVVCAESISWVRSSPTMCKIGICFGVLATLSAVRDLPFLQATPNEIKMAVSGKKSASKEAVQDLLDTMFGQVPAMFLGNLPKSKREHPYDSLGAIVACWESDPMRMARQVMV